MGQVIRFEISTKIQDPRSRETSNSKHQGEGALNPVAVSKSIPSGANDARRVLRLGAWSLELGAFSLILGTLLLLTGCTSSCPEVPSKRFDFQNDTFAFTNELVWVYQYDEKGNWTTHNREPKPTYSHHCFVVARSARQFFRNAQFDLRQPVADEKTYRRLIEQVVSSNPRTALPQDKKIVIPGYANLRTFSEAQEKLLKEECGGAWQSYFQRGHWRMLFPLSRAHQERTVHQLMADMTTNAPVVVHVVRFPQLSINHALVLFDAKENPKEIVFDVYDPNRPASPTSLTYDRGTRTFQFAPNDYFPGGRVDIYEVYHKWNY